jgi:D-alanyl-D-alanine carboxypeptidase (penicillin-binding protein 5/6)
VPPASVTKIVTAIVAIEQEKGRLDQHIPIDFDSYEMVVETQSSIMGLKPGDNPTLRDLLYGLMLPSGNDAAVVIARFIAGSEKSFVDLMNEKMRSLGLTDSHFSNPHGLDADDHYSSAYDMAALSLYGMRYELFRSLSETKKWEIKDARAYEVWNLNRLLYSYDGADGVKIGFTENALETIVASATRGQHKLIVAVMRSNSRYSDARALLDYYFGALESGEVTRIPAPKPPRTPEPAPAPASDPLPVTSSVQSSDQPSTSGASTVSEPPTPFEAASAPSATPAPQKDFWTNVFDAIGSFFGSLLRLVQFW